MQIFLIRIFLSISHSLFTYLRIIDDDTIIFKAKKIKLFWIDSLENNKYCFDKKIKHSCVLNSTIELIKFIKVNCNKSI